MKRRLKFLMATVASLAALGATVAIGGCSEGTTDEFFCDHKFEVAEVTKESSCSEEGSQKVTCTECGVTEIEVIEKLPHTEVYVAMIPMTCTETGLTDGKKCSVCEEWTVAPAVIPAAGHKTVIDPAVAPTCMETGLTAGSHCARCEVVLEEQLIVSATGHSPVAVEKEEATCEEAGHEEGLWCSNCEQIYSGCEEIPALGHQSTGWSAQSYSTADEYATWTNTCGRCKEDYTKQMPPLTATEGLTYTLSEDGTYAICSIQENDPYKIVVAATYSGAPVKIVKGPGKDNYVRYLTIPSTVEEVSEFGYSSIILRCGANSSLKTIKNVSLLHDSYAWVNLPASITILEGAFVDYSMTNGTNIDTGERNQITLVLNGTVPPVLVNENHLIIGRTYYAWNDGTPEKSDVEIDPSLIRIFVPKSAIGLYKQEWSAYADCIYAIEDMENMGVWYEFSTQSDER